MWRRYVYRLYVPYTSRLRHQQNAKEKVTRDKSTADKNEVEKFNKYVDNWWNEQGEMRALHAFNRLRVKMVVTGLVNSGGISEEKSKCPKPLESLKLLDVGCGGGIFTEPLARLGADVTGLDVSESLISTAKFHASKDASIANKIQYVCDSIENHSVAHGGMYDIVIASEVVEHVSQKNLFIESCVVPLKTGGSIFVTTLNKTTCSWLGAIIAAEKVLKLVPEGTHEWEKFVTPQELESVLDSNGCTTLLVSGMLYNPVTNKWFWTKNTSINYALHAVKK